jgi:hypothetical protein
MQFDFVGMQNIYLALARGDAPAGTEVGERRLWSPSRGWVVRWAGLRLSIADRTAGTGDIRRSSLIAGLRLTRRAPLTGLVRLDAV